MADRRVDDSRIQATDDLAGQGYWNGVWEESARQRLVDPRARGVRNHLRREFHAFFRDALGDGQGRRLIEVGCADSVWLPYFAQELGFDVVGLDYSEVGAVKARSTLNDAGVGGSVLHGDLFSPPRELVGQFDVVFSYGLVEHFTDYRRPIAALGDLCRPNGYVLTLIPNLTSLMGTLQRLLSRSVFEVHVPISLDQLSAAHEDVGLRVVMARRLMSVNFGVLNPGLAGTGVFGRLAKRVAHSALIASMLPVWWAESCGSRRLPPSDLLSPYFVVLAQK
jgi:2-polyprenyl-3-methyl-5-hydroxy-6-metoxy-1,4-benzoquinol methylase